MHEGDGWCVVGGTHTIEDWTECAQTHRQTNSQTDRQTKVKTVYPPVSLRSLGGYKNLVKFGHADFEICERRERWRNR